MNSNSAIQTRGGFPINKGSIRQKKHKKNGGIILIEYAYDNKKGRCEPAIILFRGRDLCSDGGGNQDKSDTDIKDTATRELNEESANLFRLRPSTLETVPYHIDKNYTCFFVGIQNSIPTQYFDENLAIIKKNGGPHEWREMSQLHKFYISDLRGMNLDGDGHLSGITDADGNTNLTIKLKTKISINYGLFQINKQIEFIKLNENLDFQEGSNMFLRGTKCYWL